MVYEDVSRNHLIGYDQQRPRSINLNVSTVTRRTWSGLCLVEGQPTGEILCRQCMAYIFLYPLRLHWRTRETFKNSRMLLTTNPTINWVCSRCVQCVRQPECKLSPSHLGGQCSRQKSVTTTKKYIYYSRTLFFFQMFQLLRKPFVDGPSG